MFKYFLKGANKSFLTYATLMKIMKVFFVGTCVFLVLFNVGWFYLSTTRYERHLLLTNVKANAQIQLNKLSLTGKKSKVNSLDALTMQWQTPSGKTAWVHTTKYLKSPYYTLSNKIMVKQAVEGLYVSIATILLMLLCAIALFVLKGRRSSKKKRIKGANIVTVKALNALLKKRKKRSIFPIGETYYVKDSEVEHALCVGGSGNGKTTFFLHLVEAVRNQGQKQVVFDLDGEFISHFYRPEKDVILSLTDKRSPQWSFFSECEN